MICNNCSKIIKDDANFCPYCGQESGAPKKSEEPIIIDPDSVYIQKRRRSSSLFEDFFGGGLFGGLFGDFFSMFEPEDEEYCDFNEQDYRFINPKLKFIDKKKMLVYNKYDIKKNNPDSPHFQKGNNKQA